MNVLPKMTILSPSTEEEVEEYTKELFNIKGPVYMRLGKHLCNTVNKQYIKGKYDVTLITTGETLQLVLNTKKILNNKGIYCNIYNICVLKPLNKEKLLLNIMNSKLIVVLEEHNIHGGLGSIISDNLYQHNILIPLIKIGIEDMFVGVVGSVDYIRKCLKITENDISRKIIESLK